MIGVGQKEMASLLHCATITVQKIENGGLRLSDEFAKRVSHETGVHIAWLLNGDPTAPPVTIAGAPYANEFYLRFRARKTASSKIIDELMLATYGLRCHVRIRAIIESAHRRRADFQFVRYKLDRFLDDLAAEFGEDRMISETDAFDAAMIGIEQAKESEKLLLRMAGDVLAKAKLQTASKRSSRRPRKA
jgi:transcriptional regulator with XRE-family HTH domain